MATEQDIIDQQRRVILDTKTDVNALLGIMGRLDERMETYVQLGLGDAEIRKDAAFGGTGTGAPEYVAAMVSLDALKQLLAAGHGTNLQRFAR